MEDLARVTSRTMCSAIIQRRHQNRIPEVPDRKLGLPRAPQPLLDALLVLRRISTEELHQPARHSQLVLPSQHRHAQEARSKVKGRRQAVGRDRARSAVRLEKSLLVVPANLVRTSTLLT